MKLIAPWQVTEIQSAAADGNWRPLAPDYAWYQPGMETLGTTSPATIQYGVLDRGAASGRATCRACGRKIARGERALMFCWDFHGSGSYTATIVWMHEKCKEK